MTLTMNPILKKVPFRQTVHTFEVEGTDYRLDIVETDDMFDLWLYNKDLDMKRYMFGTPKYQQYRHVTETLDSVLEMAMYNVENYIPDYEEDIDDLEDLRNKRYMND